MAKVRSVFRCTECGTQASQWAGRCTGCGEWNTIVEEVQRPKAATVPGVVADTPEPLTEIDGSEVAARSTGIDELDRVLGGGLVPGSVTLLGGEPGIGKSPLLVQVAAAQAAAGARVLYVSAEESKQQVRLRAERLRMLSPSVWLVAEVDLSSILGHIDAVRPDLVVVDSIQTVADPTLSSAPGSVSQVRECANRLVQESRRQSMSTILVGHVTKDG